MRTSVGMRKLAVIVLALLCVGITPATAQNAGLQPSSPEPAATMLDGQQDKAERFVALLEREGFTVQEGHLGQIRLDDVCCIEDAPEGFPCTYSNAANAYLAAYLPPSPGQVSEEIPYLRDPAYPDHAVAWRLRPDEAVVFVGLTPPPMRYYSFHTYRWFTLDEEGNRVRRWNNFGDQENHLTIHTAGTPNGTSGDPFSTLTVRITAADRDIDAQVRQAARRAGYAPPHMNTEPIPQSLVRLGLDEDADIFVWVLRTAMPEPGFEDAMASYRETPPVRIFRVTPNRDAPVYPETSTDPFPIPGFRIHGTGQTEFDLIPAVWDLRKGILAEHSDLEAQELMSRQWLFYGLHHMAVNDDGLGPSTDALYLRTDSFGTLEEDEFVIAYGVNHHQAGKATYMNVAMYGLTKQIAADNVDDEQLAGSAADYLGADYPDVGKLYTYKFARNCHGETNCYEVPYGCCSYQGTEYCMGEPCSPGMASIEEGIMVYRLYLDPLSKTGPDPSEIIFDSAIKFSPRP
jgi:hypothetical protein